jgi:perosamine synthetase
MKEFIPVYEPDLSGNELKYVIDCIETGWISSLGKYINLFEDAFAQFCGVEHAVAVSNGTAALHLALLLKDIGPGDEVIVPTLTFVATANAVRYTGARPVFVDSDPATWTIDPARIEEKISSLTKAVIPVHLYGHPADMDPIMELADKYDLFVIEDAAEAHGAEYKGEKVGGLGHVGCFSFYGNKIVTTGEGGMLTTNNSDLAEKARFLKDHGMSSERRYWHPKIGYNYRMTNIQAAIGLAQLERINEIIERKLIIADLYKRRLEDVLSLELHPQSDWARNVFWMFSILVKDGLPCTRDELISALRERDIDTRPFFIPIHFQPPYREDGNSFPVAEDVGRRGINLPSYPKLRETDLRRICDCIKKIARV